MNTHEWKHGLIFSMLFHILMFSVIWSAGIFWKNYRVMPPVYTVRLFESRVLPKSPPPAATKVLKKESKQPKPARKLKKTSKSSATKKPPQAIKTKKMLVSERPKKIKVKKRKKKAVAAKGPDAETLLLQKRLKKISEKVEEKREERLLEKKLSALSSMVREKQKKKEESSRQGPQTEGNQQQDEALRAYCAAIWEAVREHWSFPEHFMDQPGLMCIIVVRIQSDGTTGKMWFEKKSSNELFDRSAMRAVEEASPFPKIPKALGQAPLEIGIRFRPGQVGE